jgi:hypothetical protein
MAEVTYEQLGDRLVEVLPELAPGYQAMLEHWGDDKPGPHIVYGDLLSPWLFQMLETCEEAETLKAIFGLMEELAHNSDRHVVEVVQMTVLEYLLHDDERMNRARESYMGPRTLELSYEIERFWRTPRDSRP